MDIDLGQLQEPKTNQKSINQNGFFFMDYIVDVFFMFSWVFWWLRCACYQCFVDLLLSCFRVLGWLSIDLLSMFTDFYRWSYDLQVHSKDFLLFIYISATALQRESVTWRLPGLLPLLPLPWSWSWSFSFGFFGFWILLRDPPPHFSQTPFFFCVDF